jgi:hypothetical protein
MAKKKETVFKIKATLFVFQRYVHSSHKNNVLYDQLCGLLKMEVSRQLSEWNSTFHFYIIYFSPIIELSRINLGHKHLPIIASKLGVTRYVI